MTRALESSEPSGFTYTLPPLLDCGGADVNADAKGRVHQRAHTASFIGEDRDPRDTMLLVLNLLKYETDICSYTYARTALLLQALNCHIEASSTESSGNTSCH